MNKVIKSKKVYFAGVTSLVLAAAILLAFQAFQPQVSTTGDNLCSSEKEVGTFCPAHDGVVLEGAKPDVKTTP